MGKYICAITIVTVVQTIVLTVSFLALLWEISISEVVRLPTVIGIAILAGLVSFFVSQYLYNAFCG